MLFILSEYNTEVRCDEDSSCLCKWCDHIWNLKTSVINRSDLDKENRNVERRDLETSLGELNYFRLCRRAVSSYIHSIISKTWYWVKPLNLCWSKQTGAWNVVSLRDCPQWSWALCHLSWGSYFPVGCKMSYSMSLFQIVVFQRLDAFRKICM